VANEWAIKQISSFIAMLDSYEYFQRHRILSSLISFLRGPMAQSFEEKILAEVPAVQRILASVDSRHEKDFSIEVWYGKVVVPPRTREVLVYARTLLSKEAELDKNLTPQFSIDASQLHAWVWEAAKSLLETRHYREAVQAAGTSVNAHLQI
jgi:hypothetical protein